VRAGDYAPKKGHTVPPGGGLRGFAIGRFRRVDEGRGTGGETDDDRAAGAKKARARSGREREGRTRIRRERKGPGRSSN
jgi:hypothetical protein